MSRELDNFTEPWYSREGKVQQATLDQARKLFPDHKSLHFTIHRNGLYMPDIVRGIRPYSEKRQQELFSFILGPRGVRSVNADKIASFFVYLNRLNLDEFKYKYEIDSDFSEKSGINIEFNEGSEQVIAALVHLTGRGEGFYLVRKYAGEIAGTVDNPIRHNDNGIYNLIYPSDLKRLAANFASTIEISDLL